MNYKKDDSIGQNKCLERNCPNYCCSEKFIALDESLEYIDTTTSSKPVLDEDEY